MAKKSMDCKEFNKLIPSFIEDTLEGKEAVRFLDHMNECEECREEVHIQYLVREGLARLEDGSNFNLSGELNNKVDEYRRDLKHRKQALIVLYIFEGIAVIGAAFIIALVFVLKG